MTSKFEVGFVVTAALLPRGAGVLDRPGTVQTYPILLNTLSAAPAASYYFADDLGDDHLLIFVHGTKAHNIVDAYPSSGERMWVSQFSPRGFSGFLPASPSH